MEKVKRLCVLFIGSKIQFSESKSQLHTHNIQLITSCLSVQRYNFLKANHNCRSAERLLGTVVYRFKDTIFWKQITTLCLNNFHCILLFIGSKIQFSESKSQLLLSYIKPFLSCLSVQRYNFLKANHNWVLQFRYIQAVVYRFKDTIFWKQITTNHQDGCTLFGCLSVQRYNFLKANHNLAISKYLSSIVVYRFKDTIFWKQITTSFFSLWITFRLFIGSKIQFSESKSQLFKIISI